MDDMEETSWAETDPSPPGPTVSPSSKSRERPSKSPRRRREARRSQRGGGGGGGGDDDDQPLQEAVSRGLVPTPAHTDTAEEGSPKRRAHFLHGPYPATHFGPKACILPNPTSVMHIQDPASQRLTWNKPPSNVLVIRKIRDDSLVEPFKELCRFLVEEKQMMVYVERRVVEDATLSDDQSFASVCNQLCTFREGFDDISDCIDLIICLGGDGTLLYASSLFQGSVPPVMAFHLGSLGFLTPFKFDSYKTEVAKVFEGNAAITLRSRLKVKVVKAVQQKPDHQEQPPGEEQEEHNGFLCPPCPPGGEGGKVTLQLQVLNEVVVDRGPSSYLSNVDLPIVVPAGVELTITLSPDARNTAWVSFDGRKRQEIQHGDCIKITTSCYPVPSICCHDLVYDWFESLAQCLHWNVRKRQARLASPSDSSDTEN
ncbi:hypothetical protein NHX12_005014 [Muraenolepis orangiensis]|uniref:NAD(+) kinase n=1 Tax=Muraenolepis orangiensis TaxID=630683 RepID=A0A9Q0DXW3_9TELE|nr:hypothetical protein NHX12_005014 [Muraenolepis orangiensis]